MEDSIAEVVLDESSCIDDGEDDGNERRMVRLRYHSSHSPAALDLVNALIAARVLVPDSARRTDVWEVNSEFLVHTTRGIKAYVQVGKRRIARIDWARVGRHMGWDARMQTYANDILRSPRVGTLLPSLEYRSRADLMREVTELRALLGVGNKA